MQTVILLVKMIVLYGLTSKCCTNKRIALKTNKSRKPTKFYLAVFFFPFVLGYNIRVSGTLIETRVFNEIEKE